MGDIYEIGRGGERRKEKGERRKEKGERRKENGESRNGDGETRSSCSIRKVQISICETGARTKFSTGY